MPELARLSEIELRKVWAHEERSFSSWLAEKENLNLLAEELGIELELVQREAPVGSFEADILAKEVGTGRKVLIENQLTATDHAHLGKLITYASGLDVAVIVWIVGDVREEHRRAIEWLNEHTDQEVGFFLVQIKVYQIGGSPYAPKFHIVAQPNDWARTVKRAFGSDKITQTQLLQYEYWTTFKEYARHKTTSFQLRNPGPRNYYDLSIGSSHAHIALTVNVPRKRISVALYIPENQSIFQCLHKEKDSIEHSLGVPLEWSALPDKQASRIETFLSGSIENKEEWPRFHEWMLKTAEKFKAVFGPRIKACLQAAGEN